MLAKLSSPCFRKRRRSLCCGWLSSRNSLPRDVHFINAFPSPPTRLLSLHSFSLILPVRGVMLEQELSEMDRVTQLQDAIEEVGSSRWVTLPLKLNASVSKLFDIMSKSIKYLSDHSSSIQVAENIPITKTDPRSVPPEEFEGANDI